MAENLCSQALTAREGEVAACKETVDAATTRLNTLTTTVADRDAELQAWYRNPAVVAALGLVVGVLATTYVTRK